MSPYVGTLSMKSGAVAHGQTSALQFSGRFRDGVVSFARRVSSQSGQDELRFYIDDVLQGSWSGEVAWGMVAYPVSAGEHTLRWAYVKDGSGAAGSDSAWIDSVNLPLDSSGLAPRGVRLRRRRALGHLLAQWRDRLPTTCG